MLNRLKTFALADIQLILSLFTSSIIFLFFKEQFLLFLALTFVFQIYLRSLSFSFLVYKALDQAKMAKPLISLKVLVSALRAIITAFFIFLSLKYFGFNFYCMLSAVMLCIASLVTYGVLKNS